MGTFTSNIGLYIPAAGESNYEAAFAEGMMNLDVHDHSGGPNKGVPITSSGLGDFSVTYQKLNSNVADNSTGIGTNSSPGSQNQLQLLGVLRNLYALASASGAGLLAINGQSIFARELLDSTDGSITWTHRDGVAGNPLPQFNIGGISPVPVANGGTGDTSFTPYEVLIAGATGTAPLDQVSGVGTSGQYLGSQGAGMPPIWTNVPTIPPQVVYQATITISAAQFIDLVANPVQIVPNVPGSIIIPLTAYGFLNYTGTSFSSGSAVYLGWGSSFIRTNVRFDSGTFKDSNSGYYVPTFTAPSTTAIPVLQNRSLYVGVNSSDFSGGGTNTVTITVFYTLASI